MASASRVPMPPQLNTFSVSTAPASSSPTCSPMVVDTGSSALRSTCRLRIDARGEALGVGGAHEVRVEHVEHRRPGDPDDHRERDGGQRDRGQHQVAAARPRLASHSRVSSPSSTAKPVTSVASMSTACRPDGGNQPSSTANTRLEQVAEEEHRHRHADQGADDRWRRPAGGRAAARRGSPAGCPAAPRSAARRPTARWWPAAPGRSRRAPAGRCSVEVPKSPVTTRPRNLPYCT